MPWGESFPAGDVGPLDESRERAERIRSDHRLADVARAYCAAMHELRDGSVDSDEIAQINVDRAYYELMRLCGYFADESAEA